MKADDASAMQFTATDDSAMVGRPTGMLNHGARVKSFRPNGGNGPVRCHDGAEVSRCVRP